MIPNIEIYRWLKRYGYLPGVRLNEIGKLDNASVELRSAAEKMQLLYGHEVLGQPDSIIGPRTVSAMLLPRCGHPDFPDSEIGNYQIDLNEISREIKSVLECTDCEAFELVYQHHRLGEAVGRGSWSMPCQKEGVKIFIDRSRAPQNLDIDRLIQVNLDAYASVGLKLVLQGSKSLANIGIEWRILKGNVIGLAEFNNQKCDDYVFCYLDPGFNPSFVMVAQLLQHELGHNNNLQHTNGGVMNPVIERITQFRGWQPSDPSYNTLVRYFGGEPIEPTDPPTTPVPSEFSGVLVGGGNLYQIQMRKV